jgi:adenine-specific DNA-methyltransferase
MARLEWQGRSQAEELIRNATLSMGMGSGTENCSQTLENRLICGDNLGALRYLSTRDSERFHFVYIDPPYNTGQQFAYSDRMPGAGSDSWLSFMYPRLFLGRELLRPDGLFCVSIDDHEHPNLSVLLREIFGSENHLMTIKWRRKRKPSFLSKHVSQVFEYILIFAKDARQLPKLRGEAATETSRPVLNHGNALVERTIRVGTAARCADGGRPIGEYKIRSLGYKLLDPLIVKNSKVTSQCRIIGPFRVGQELLDRTLFITRDWGLRRMVEESEMGHKHVSDDGSLWPTNEDADKETVERFGDRVFSFAKPTRMLCELIKMYPVGVGGAKDGVTAASPLRFLDFFAGTGSFGEAVHLQSSLDEIPRNFTLVQSAEPFANPALPHCNTIFDLAVHRLAQIPGLELEIVKMPSDPWPNPTHSGPLQ